MLGTVWPQATPRDRRTAILPDVLTSIIRPFANYDTKVRRERKFTESRFTNGKGEEFRTEADRLVPHK